MSGGRGHCLNWLLWVHVNEPILINANLGRYTLNSADAFSGLLPGLAIKAKI